MPEHRGNSSKSGWSATSSMSGGRWSASATLLGSSSNGTTSQKVLIAGGINGTASLNTAQLYHQTDGTWVAAGNLNASRHLHTATLLADGRVLVCGGMNGSTVLTSAALYSPASGSGSWATTIGPIPPPGWRSGTATLIRTSNAQLSNKVLLAGGNNGTNTISAVFLFDPAQSAFSTLASMPSPREGHEALALSDGRILFSGGKNGQTRLASAVIFDPSWGPGNWVATGSMTSPRWGHAMNLLPSGVLTQGLVLVSGGSNGTSTLSSTEYWNGTSVVPAPVPATSPRAAPGPAQPVLRTRSNQQEPCAAKARGAATWPRLVPARTSTAHPTASYKRPSNVARRRVLATSRRFARVPAQIAHPM